MSLVIKPSPSEGEPAAWRLAFFEQAVAEAKSFLTEPQYAHAVEQFELLAQEEDPTHPVLADVKAINDFHELRDKGGVLGKINLRVYFWVCDAPLRIIVVLGAWKKEAEGKTPPRILARMKSRRRLAEQELAVLQRQAR
jgi:hypothetical protein